jgi:hypothetical protein
MMIGHALPPALPDVRPALRLAGPAQPFDSIQGRRVGLEYTIVEVTCFFS